jgi:hypothetical protein
MSRLKIAGLALASMLVMGMAVTGSASAALLWLVCLEGSGLTKYESSTCLKAASGGKWQSLGVPTGASISVKLLVISILLIDTKVPILGEVSVKCSNAGSRGRGLIKPNGEGEIIVAEYENPEANCKEEKGCPKVTKVKGVHLPWKVKLFVGANGEPLSKIEPINGEPGWEVTCAEEPLVGEVTDVCETPKGEEEQVRFLNSKSATELLVIALFEENIKSTCSQGKEKAGVVKGSVAILLPGGALSINPV